MIRVRGDPSRVSLLWDMISNVHGFRLTEAASLGPFPEIFCPLRFREEVLSSGIDPGRPRYRPDCQHAGFVA